MLSAALTPGPVTEQTVDVEARGVTLLSHQTSPDDLSLASDEIRQYVETTLVRLTAARRLPHAVISGRVIDANGDPLEQIRFTKFACRTSNAERQGSPVSHLAPSQPRTSRT